MTSFLIFCAGAFCGAVVITILAILAVNPPENSDD